MKRALSLHVCLGLALIFSLLFAGCNKSDSSTKGTSTGNSSSPTSNSSSSSASSGKAASSNRFVGTGRSVDAPELSLVFKDDGTVMIMSTRSTTFISGSYVASGDTVTIKDEGSNGDSGTATITGDGRLKFTDETGKAVYYVKE